MDKDKFGGDLGKLIEGRWEKLTAGKWEQLKGKIQKNWGKLTNDDLDVVNGNMKELIGKIQEKYAVNKAEAMKQIQDFMKKK